MWLEEGRVQAQGYGSERPSYELEDVCCDELDEPWWGSDDGEPGYDELVLGNDADDGQGEHWYIDDECELG